jgi:hypothetical protein
MPGEHSIFDSEWWWPKWSVMPSLPLPPSPQQQDQSTLRAFETDLEPGANVLLSSDSGKLSDQDPLLMAYPDRLWSISKIAVGMEAVFETRQPIYYFMLLRHCDLNLIDHKLLHLEARLHATQGTYISNAEKQELGNLLQDQEGIFQLQVTNTSSDPKFEATAVRNYEYMTIHLNKSSMSLIEHPESLFPEIKYAHPPPPRELFINSFSEYRIIP